MKSFAENRKREHVLIRTEAGGETGYGHLIRSLALGKEFHRRGCEVDIFISGDFNLHPSLSEGMKPLRIIFESEKAFAAEGYELIASDFRSENLKKLYEASGISGRILHMSVHDLGLNRMDSDIVVDGSVKAPGIYSKTQGKFYFLGPEYMILRSSLSALKRPAPARKRRKPVCFMSFGGGDQIRCHEFASVMFETANFECEIIVAPGFHCSREAVEDIWSAKGIEVRFCEPENEPWEEGIRADFAIVAAGITLYEALALGVPAFTLPMDERQNETADIFFRNGACLNPGAIDSTDAFSAAKHFKSWLGDASKRMRSAHIGSKMVDLRGAERVVNSTLQLLRHKHETNN